MKRALFVLVVLAVFATALTANSFAGGPGNSDAAKACQKHGYKSLYRSDGSGFKNTGDCVSYAAHGGTFQTKCQPGSWSATGVTPCTPASVGFYVSTVGATSQTPCPSGQTTSGTGSTSIAACHPIAVPCSPGTYSATGNTPCIPAAVGFYVPAPHATSQTPCPSGATTNGTGSTSIADCKVCIGENYDVDGNLNNGCELFQTLPAHTQGTALSLGSVSCFDSPPHVVTGHLYSDLRAHNPGIAGFVASVGSAPEWYSVNATGGFLCLNDYSVTFTTTGGPSNVGCYRLTIATDHGSQSVIVNGHGSATMSAGGIQPAYSSGSTIYFEVEKICSLPITEAVSYTISFHL